MHNVSFFAVQTNSALYKYLSPGTFPLNWDFYHLIYAICLTFEGAFFIVTQLLIKQKKSNTKQTFVGFIKYLPTGSILGGTIHS